MVYHLHPYPYNFTKLPWSRFWSAASFRTRFMEFQCFMTSARGSGRNPGIHTVDGRFPAPVDRRFIPLFKGFQLSKVVQDFFHPPYFGGFQSMGVSQKWMVLYWEKSHERRWFLGYPHDLGNLHSWCQSKWEKLFGRTYDEHLQHQERLWEITIISSDISQFVRFISFRSNSARDIPTFQSWLVILICQQKFQQLRTSWASRKNLEGVTVRNDKPW